MYYIDFFFGALPFWRKAKTKLDGQPRHYPVRWRREPPPHLPSQAAKSSHGQWRRNEGVGVGGIWWRTHRCCGTGSLPVISVSSMLSNLANYLSHDPGSLSLTRRLGFSTSADNPHIIKGHECSTTYKWTWQQEAYLFLLSSSFYSAISAAPAEQQLSEVFGRLTDGRRPTGLNWRSYSGVGGSG